MRVIAVYDNGGKTLDRYTIVTNNRVSQKHNGKYTYDAIAASENGLGVFLWCQCIRGKHLGKKIQFNELSTELQNKVKLALH